LQHAFPLMQLLLITVLCVHSWTPAQLACSAAAGAHLSHDNKPDHAVHAVSCAVCRLFAATPKVGVWDCGACTKPSADKSFVCPKNDASLTQALKAHGHASALLLCCGQTLPATFKVGASDSEVKAWVNTLQNKYACTDLSHMEIKVQNGNIKESGTVVTCGKGTILQCL
jgi:hypothetical protein